MQKTANDIARRLFAAFLSLVLVVVLLPAAAAAAADLPDWYFLFVIFKNVDADCQNANDEVTHIKYTMTRKEIDLAGEYAEWFEKFMNGVGVMRAHVDVLTIDATVTELAESDYGAYLNSDQAAPLLKGKVDLDRYDHVIGIVNFTMRTGAGGMTDLPFENGTGFSSINFFHSSNTSYSQGSFVHEFLHFMEDRSGAWGGTFDLHGIIEKYYNKQYSDINGLTDIMLNRVKKNAETGTGVTPAAWQYPPRVLRAMRELVIPSGVTSIGYSAFYRYGNLESVIISNGVTSIGDYAFNRCSGLKSVTIPASVTSIGYATFGNTKVKDVYYGGTEAQWRAVHIGEYNSGLANAAIHYAESFTDVPANAYYAAAVTWAVGNGITDGISETEFGPDSTVTRAQAVTFLYRAFGNAKSGQDGSHGLNIASIIFDDVDNDAYYVRAVYWAVTKGITNGTSDTTFSPDDPVTYAQMLTFLARAKGEMITGADWARDAVDWAQKNGATDALRFTGGDACPRRDVVYIMHRVSA